MNTPSISLLYARWCQYQKQHPEWWALSLAAGGWLFFIAAGLSDLAFRAGFSWIQIGHAAPHAAPELHTFLNFGMLNACFLLLLHWSFMIAAMMFPLLIGPLRTVAIRSFGFRRDRAMFLFLCGYTALWLLYGLVAEASLQLQQTFLPVASSFLVPLSFFIAACWQLTQQKNLSIVACHCTMPLAPSGWHADFDCFHYGFRIATSCCMSCWALMFTNVVTHHALWAMLVVSIVSWLERYFRSPQQLWFFLSLMAIGAVYFLISFGSDRVMLPG